MINITKTWKGFRIGSDTRNYDTIIITSKQIICIDKKGTTETKTEFHKKILIELEK